MTDKENLATYIGSFVDELVRSGVDHAVVCPGSRSTPIAMMMAEHPGVNIWMHVDERSAAYFALGIAKARKQPVVILCSSGTATANFFPAIVEAHESHVPLIVLTADRPHELRDVGAPQAIDQIKLYGDYVKWFMEMAPPESTSEMLRYVRMMARRASATAQAVPGGPVHLNFPFREPLVPELSTSVWQDERGNNGVVSVSHPVRKSDPAMIENLARELRDVERGLIVCGPQEDGQLPEAITRLAEKLRFPILADPLSQLRSGSHDKMWVIDGYDAFLRDERVVESCVPEVILRFGAMPVSKAFLLYVKKHPDCRQIIIDEGIWREPTQSATDMMMVEPTAFCRDLVGEIDFEKENTWGKMWIRLNEAAQTQVMEFTTAVELPEGQVFTELSACLPPKSLLFVGNSMPVRDLDTFFMNNTHDIRTMANRGANGIDGVVSAALGASTIRIPLVLVIGDLSFYHDMNGLLAAKMYDLNATIIVVNNNGGGIFSFLPQANEPDHFETLFGTPTDLDFEKAVEMYGGTHTMVKNMPHFRQEVNRAVATDGLDVIEVKTDRAENTAGHRELWDKVSREVRLIL